MKKVKMLLTIMLVAVVMEVLFFNFTPIWDRISGRTNLNEVYSLLDCQAVNWVQVDDTLVTGSDPMLILEKINHEIREVRIESDCLEEIPYVNLFYTNDRYLQFGEGPVILQTVEDSDVITININDTVKDLRIDLGDTEGIVLHEITVTVNPSQFQISVSRITAIILIICCGKFLLSLQRHPSYFSDFSNAPSNFNSQKNGRQTDKK